MKIGELSKSQSLKSVRIILSLTLFLAILIPDKIYDLSSMTEWNWVFPFALYLSVYILIGYDVLFEAFMDIIHLKPLNENFLMGVATIGAFSLAIYNGINGKPTEGFDEGCAVLIFYQIGELFQEHATEKTRRSVSELMDIRPDHANLVSNGETVKVSPENVKIGDRVVVYPGERIPLDGRIVKGSSSLDMRSLNGESMPITAMVGDTVLSGSINLISSLEIEVDKEFYDSTASKILELVESAADKKSKTERFISKFARIYTPVVVFLALILATVPPMFMGNYGEWIHRSLSFLVVSCPCAIVISVPMTFFVAIGVCSKNQILVKGSEYLEKLDNVGVFVFDKTGTLTSGEFSIDGAYPENRAEEIMRLASIAEQNSSHPIGRSIIQAYKGNIEKGYVLENRVGLGVVATRDDDIILCGNTQLMELYGIEFKGEDPHEGNIHVAHNGQYIGMVIVSDKIKSASESAISTLEKMNVKSVMFTGDREEIAKKVAESVGISEYKASMLPQNKLSELEKLMENEEKSGRSVCFLGDGINDAPALMRAHVGISMGSIGSDAAIEASDIVLMEDDIGKLPLAKRIAQKTVRIAKENIIIPLAIKIGILILSSLGITNMWMAVFGDVGVAILAILNSLRVYKIK